MRASLLTRRQLLQGGAAAAGVAVLAGGGLLALRTQQPKVWRLGFLGPSFYGPPDDTLPEALQELGYVEGQNLTIEYRRAGGQLERLPALADELIRLGVDALITAGTSSALAAKEATSTIPIVMVFGIDPIGAGVVQSLARPGGNVTGFVVLATELGAKRLELLKETVPGLTRVGVLTRATNPTQIRQWNEAERAARVVGIEAQLLEIREVGDFAVAIEAATRDRCEALLTAEDPLFVTWRADLIQAAARSRLPVFYSNGTIVRAGGLMSYGPDYADHYRRAAVYLDRIFQGAKPANLPVEQPSRLDFLVNLRAAREIGLTVPDSILRQATEIFE